MKKPLLLLLCLFTVIGYAKDPHIKAVYALIERVTPGYGKQIKLQLIAPANGEDVYEISSEKGKVLLKGNNAIALSTAFNQYLKYTCNAHVSWLGNQLNLPENLPLPQKTIRNTINGKYRVYMNYCTVSYTAAYWDWERWQREIDFMAMNSINMPLATVGLEAVWYNTLLKQTVFLSRFAVFCRINKQKSKKRFPTLCSDKKSFKNKSLLFSFYAPKPTPS